jgi:hypothetical protein
MSITTGRFSIRPSFMPKLAEEVFGISSEIDAEKRGSRMVGALLLQTIERLVHSVTLARVSMIG